MSIQGQRLSDTIVDRFDPARVNAVIAEVNSVEGMTSQQTAQSLVLSGLALGAEAVEGYLARDRPAHIALLKGLVDKINTLIEESTSMETTNTLVELRAPLTEKLNTHLKHTIGEYLTRYSHIYGIPEALVSSEVEPAMLPSNDLIATGAEVMRRFPITLFGWHLARKDGTLSTMGCTCPSCLGNVFATQRGDEPLLPDRAFAAILSEGNGLDSQLEDFAVAILSGLRKKVANAGNGVSLEHDIDPAEAESVAQRAMQRMIGGM